jgi:hypothetical protein
MRNLSVLSACLGFAIGISGQAHAVILLETADPTHNTTTPGDNSGWQYEGRFIYFLGVPIAPHFFITAAHFGGTVGVDSFNFHGEIYTTIAKHDIAGTDLRIWEVDHAKPFQTYAPLYSGPGETGSTATVYGRGTLRSASIWTVGGESKGYIWGGSSSVQRWGRNVIEGTVSGGAFYGTLLYGDFNNPGIQDECHLSTGDSGGGVFLMQDGLWRLAGVNFSVDGAFRLPADGPTPAGPKVYAALFDRGGLEIEGPQDVWTSVPNGDDDITSSFYSTPIALHTAAILSVTGGDGSLAPENYSAWKTLYFTPTEIANTYLTGPLGDYDSDGISNLLEFALNLDPSFNAQTPMTASTGFCGLPLVKLENISGSEHLTIEFVRRTAGSGSGLTCTAQFSSDAEDWLAVGTAVVTAINPRWERVKVVDPETTSSETRRFARVKVSM